MIKIAVIACHETDDIELIIPVAIWRKAHVRVDIISLDKKNSIILQSGTKFSCNGIIEKTNFSQYNAIYLPGGIGSKRYFLDDWTPKNEDVVKRLHKTLDQFSKNDKKYILTLDQSPRILHELELLSPTIKVTGNPELATMLKNNYVDENIVVSKNIISGKQIAEIFDFSFRVIEELVDKKSAAAVKSEYFPK